MAKKICLDTDLAIAILNGEARAEKFRNALSDNELYISSVTVFELFLRKSNLDKISIFLTNVGILYFDDKSAIEASEIYKELEKNGRIIGINDIFIASIAITNNCSLATFNKKHFLRIKNLELLG